MNFPLTILEGFISTNDPMDYVVGGSFALIGLPKSNGSSDGPDKAQFKKTPMTMTTQGLCTLPDKTQTDI